MGKMPAFQFYPADWKKDPGVQALSRHDRSVWFDMLLIMHESNERGVLLLAGKPMPESALAMLLNLDNQEVKQILSTLLTYGVASQRQDGAIFSRRMVSDEKLIQIRREAGKKGGNPVLLKQKSTTGVKQNPTPSSSSSSSSSNTKKIASMNAENETKENALKLYELYPLKKAKQPSLKAIEKALKIVSFETIETGIKNYTEDISKSGAIIAHCSTWMNQSRWEDEPTPPKREPAPERPQAANAL